jgi:hypothetical protein
MYANTHNEILSSVRKEISVICGNMDEPGRHYYKWIGTKIQILWSLRNSDSPKQSIEWRLPGSEGRMVQGWLPSFSYDE